MGGPWPLRREDGWKGGGKGDGWRVGGLRWTDNSARLSRPCHGF